MHAEPEHGRPILATALPVAIAMVLHAGISTAIIAAVDPDVPDLVVYSLVSVLGPSLLWAALVLGRAAAWRQPSAFWLGASAGIVVLVAFIAAVVIFVGNVSAKGIPLAIIYSSWVLLGCAVAVGVVLRLLGRHRDAPNRRAPGVAAPGTPLADAHGDSTPAAAEPQPTDAAQGADPRPPGQP